MSIKIEQYRRGLEECAAHADRSPTEEIRNLWITVGRSYEKLLVRELRLETEACVLSDTALS